MTPIQRSKILATVMRLRTAISLAILLVLIALPPVALASESCASMGLMCEAPCGATACAVVVPGFSPGPELVSGIERPRSGPLPSGSVSSLEPPPKLAFSAL